MLQRKASELLQGLSKGKCKPKNNLGIQPFTLKQQIGEKKKCRGHTPKHKKSRKWGFTPMTLKNTKMCRATLSNQMKLEMKFEMKIISWNIRCLNTKGKQAILKKQDFYTKTKYHVAAGN
jgi:hypothetical protein